ncbi:MAG: zinc ribbon domain-containing protein [Methanoregula sp.]|uniref:zinc ribbon domain-containing protein n=1 Tax=Methanoregula sp. TaxID=2052170 RepID=UPI003C786043
MDDPELHGDEQILMRTQGVHVKSISFEAILTNKRIILVDRLKGILPPKEIPLATIQSVEAGENAIRDLIVSLGVITKTGGTRQMVLTFSREGGGNRSKERDEWVRQIKAHHTPSFEQVMRKVIPGMDTAQSGQNKVAQPAYEMGGRQVPPARPADFSPSVKKIMENPPESWQAPTPAPAPAPAPAPEEILGTYCTRCGTKVPDGSGFCNNCGTRIVRPGETIPTPAPKPAPSTPAAFTALKGRPIDQDIQSIEPLIGKSVAQMPRDPPRPIPPTPAFSQPVSPEPANPAPAAWEQPIAREQPATATPVKKRFMPRLFSPKDLPPTPLVPASMPTSAPPRPKKPVNKKKIVLVIGIIVIILLAVVAAAVILPKMGSLGNLLHSSSGSSSAAATAAGTAPTAPSTVDNSSAIVVATQTPVSIPQTGVYVYVNYLGGWTGTYGTSDNLQKDTNSGEKDMEVVNATGVSATGNVAASFSKQDGSSHAITVSIYKDGKLLSTGSTTAPNGKVTLSVNVTTGVAQQPVVSGGSSTTTVATTAPVTNTTVKSTTAVNTTATTK